MLTTPGYVTRAVVFTLDPSPVQDRMLRNYLGAARFGFNWALGQVTDNLTVRAAERDAGVAEDKLTPALSWSKYSLRKQFNTQKADQPANSISTPWRTHCLVGLLWSASKT